MVEFTSAHKLKVRFLVLGRPRSNYIIYSQLRQVGSQPRSDMKAALIKSIYLWDVLPSVEE
jgi:hypothetical protein